MINVGIIGAGRMGKTHAGCLLKIQNVCIKSIYDMDMDAASKLAKDCEAKVVTDSSEIMDASEIQAVIICPPTPAHHEYVMAALAQRKNVFCEKPLARTLEQGHEMVKMLRENPVIFTVGFVHRNNWGCQQIKKLIDEGAVGVPRIGRIALVLGVYQRLRGDWFANFDACGGVILDMLAHSFDLMRWYSGSPERVCADGWLLDNALPEPMDYVSGTIRFKNKLICNVEGGWLRLGLTRNLIEIAGDEGVLSLDWSAKDTVTLMTKDKERKEFKRPADVSGDVFQMQMQNFLDCVEKGEDPKVTLEDGMNSMALSLAMIESVQKKQTIEM